MPHFCQWEIQSAAFEVSGLSDKLSMVDMLSELKKERKAEKAKKASKADKGEKAPKAEKAEKASKVDKAEKAPTANKAEKESLSLPGMLSRRQTDASSACQPAAVAEPLPCQSPLAATPHYAANPYHDLSPMSRWLEEPVASTEGFDRFSMDFPGAACCQPVHPVPDLQAWFVPADASTITSTPTDSPRLGGMMYVPMEAMACQQWPAPEAMASMFSEAPVVVAPPSPSASWADDSEEEVREQTIAKAGPRVVPPRAIPVNTAPSFAFSEGPRAVFVDLSKAARRVPKTQA